MSRSLTALLFLALLATGCGTDTAPGAEPTTTVPVPGQSTTTAPCSSVSGDDCAPDGTSAGPPGDVSVTVGGVTYEFRATRCLVNVDVFVVDGVSADGAETVAMRHASPPTRPDPQPSMSYIVIQPEPRYETPPAALVFDTYDPAAGTATGTAEPGVAFTVACER